MTSTSAIRAALDAFNQHDAMLTDLEMPRLHDKDAETIRSVLEAALVTPPDVEALKREFSHRWNCEIEVSVSSIRGVVSMVIDKLSEMGALKGGSNTGPENVDLENLEKALSVDVEYRHWSEHKAVHLAAKGYLASQRVTDADRQEALKELHELKRHAEQEDMWLWDN